MFRGLLKGSGPAADGVFCYGGTLECKGIPSGGVLGQDNMTDSFDGNHHFGGFTLDD